MDRAVICPETVQRQIIRIEYDLHSGKADRNTPIRSVPSSKYFRIRGTVESLS